MVVAYVAGDGRVTVEEFALLCNECELGITPHQARQLLREIARSSDGRGVDIADFIERFQVLYVGSSGHSLMDKVTEPWARDLISKVGRAIVGGGESATDVFRQFDKDNSGFIIGAELRHVVSNLGVPVDEDEVEEIEVLSRSFYDEVARSSTCRRGPPPPKRATCTWRARLRAAASRP